MIKPRLMITERTFACCLLLISCLFNIFPHRSFGLGRSGIVHRGFLLLFTSLLHRSPFCLSFFFSYCFIAHDATTSFMDTDGMFTTGTWAKGIYSWVALDTNIDLHILVCRG